jgi:ADP-ribosylglycohydrolase
MTDMEEFKGIPVEQIKSSGYVVDSIEAAVWCLLHTDNIEECLLKAANLGHDTDTVAAIAGGLAGLYYGYEEIPERWMKKIQRREWVEDLCVF